MIGVKTMHTIKVTYDSLLSQKGKYEADWKAITRFVFPGADNWDDDPDLTSTGSSKDRYDTSSVSMLDKYARGLQAWACGESVHWIGLALENKPLETSKEVKEYLQYVSRSMEHILSRSDSNFYEESELLFKSGAALGTGVMLTSWDEEQQVPVYECLHIKDVAGMQSKKTKKWDTLYIRRYLNRMDAEELCGSYDALPEAVKRETDETKNFKFIQLIAPQKRFRTNEPGGRYINVIWFDGEDKPIKVWTTEHKGFAVWRPSRSLGGGVFGCDSPGQRMLPGIKGLNIMEKATWKGAQLLTDMPIKKTPGLKVHIEPGGETELRDNENFSFVAGAGGDMQWTEVVKNRIREDLNESFFVDFFTSVSSRKDKTMTAAEVYQLTDEQANMLAPFVSRLRIEYLEPVIEDLFYHLYEHGRLEDETHKVPAELLNGNSFKNIEVDYISPLSRIQRRANEITPAKQLLASVLEIMQVYPQISDKFNFDAYVSQDAEVSDVDVRLIKTQEEVDKIRAERAQAQAQQQQLQNQLATYQAMKDAPEEGSPLTQQQGGMM